MTTDPIKALKMGQPLAWVIPGDDNVRHDGWLDARIDQQGEFSKPLYSLEQITAAIEALAQVSLDQKNIGKHMPDFLRYAYEAGVSAEKKRLAQLLGVSP